jgi:hypothetical protein
MAVLENSPKNYGTMISEIMTGQVKIPQFQRQFVWDKVSSAKLIDSMIKGYPIGTFIFWRTDEELRSVRNIGNIVLPIQDKGEFVNYVLDGQQRITSIFAAIKGEQIARDDGKKEDFSGIYIDLDAKGEDDIIIIDVTDKTADSTIRLTDLMEGSFELLASYPKERHATIQNYQNILKGYSFNVINLKEASIDVATEVFTRLNVGGKSLTLFEIMVAKTYDVTSKFDLAEKYGQLKSELARANYDDIPSATVLQVVSMLLKKDVKRSAILKLDKHEFIKMWPTAVDCIKKSIDFFRGYGVVVSRLLPYPALIVPFSYFFHKHKNNPTGDMKKRLEDFFWRVSLGTRYSSAVESKMAQDVQKIDRILVDKQPKYEWSIDVTPENLMELSVGWFGTGRSLVKAILCLYAMHKPKSFDSNQDVIIDNSWLKVSTSKNYHHFFPRAYMKKSHPDVSYWVVNHILNITIVDDFLNKSKIKAKAPSHYMEQFRQENDDIEKTMKTHLIGNFDKFGINDDDYNKFFKERAKLVSRELTKRLIEQETGHEEQVEEFEEIEVEPGVELTEDI